MAIQSDYRHGEETVSVQRTLTAFCMLLQTDEKFRRQTQVIVSLDVKLETKVPSGSLQKVRFYTSINLISFSQGNSDLKKQTFKYFCSLNVLIFAQFIHSSL